MYFRWEGIADQPRKNPHRLDKFEMFHYSPAVKIFYHFVSYTCEIFSFREYLKYRLQSVYIWFLLAFSFMMLFRMASETVPIHWTEIYVFITVTAMLFEDIRKVSIILTLPIPLKIFFLISRAMSRA